MNENSEIQDQEKEKEKTANVNRINSENKYSSIKEEVATESESEPDE